MFRVLRLILPVGVASHRFICERIKVITPAVPLLFGSKAWCLLVPASLIWLRSTIEITAKLIVTYCC